MGQRRLVAAAYRLLAMDERMAEVRRRIRAIMDAKRWSGAELGRQMQPPESREWVSARLKDDGADLRLADIYRMADAFGVSSGVLLGSEPPPVPILLLDSLDRRKAENLSETSPAWATGVMDGVIERDRQFYAALFQEGVLNSLNRLGPKDRQIVLRLIGVIDDLLDKVENPE